MATSDENDVKDFLREFRSLIKSNKFYVINRYENNEGLIELGITKKIRKQELLSLNKLNYSSGPTPDVDRPGEVWVFGKTIRLKEVYIKLKIVSLSRGNKAKCISFHPTDSPLPYPFLPEKNNPEL